MSETTVKEVTLTQAKTMLYGWWKYVLSKWLWIGLTGILFGVIGILYAQSKKPIYTAELTFASDAAPRNMSSYASLASQFGMDLGGGGAGGAFEGENLVVLLRSRTLLEKTLLTQIEVNGKKQTLINYLILSSREEEEEKGPVPITFSPDYKHGNRVSDSIMKNYFRAILGTLDVNKIDRRLDIIQIKLLHENELFAKLFVENLASNAIQYYVDYRSKKAKQNVTVLERQTDSVRRLISGGIVAIAVSQDLNVNPMKQVMRTGVQRKGVDVQVNTALYTQLVTNLQAARMSLREGTPFIQIIDSPLLPLDKNKLGRAKAGVLFGFLGLFVGFIFFSVKRMF